MSQFSYGSCDCLCHQGSQYVNTSFPGQWCCACHAQQKYTRSVNPEEINLDILLALQKRIHELENHKNLQIEENRKISRRVDEMEKLIFDTLTNIQHRLGKLENPKYIGVCRVLSNEEFVNEAMKRCLFRINEWLDEQESK